MFDTFCEVIYAWGHRYWIEVGTSIVFLLFMHFVAYPLIERRALIALQHPSPAQAQLSPPMEIKRKQEHVARQQPARKSHTKTSNGTLSESSVGTSSASLVDEALLLSANIRRLSGNWNERRAVLQGSNLDEQDRIAREKVLDAQTMNEYDRLYKGQSNDLHTQLLRQLPPESEDEQLKLFYERGFNADSLETNASDLERLARLVRRGPIRP